MKHSIYSIKWLAFSLLVFIMSSCTITKRVHQKGWHVEWRKSYKQSESKNHLSSNKEKTVELKEKPSKSDFRKNEVTKNTEPKSELTNDIEIDSKSDNIDLSPSKIEQEHFEEQKDMPSFTTQRTKRQEKTAGDNKVLNGKLIVALGIILTVIIGVIGVSDLLIAIGQLIGLGTIIAGSIVWIKGRRLQEAEGTRTGKSEEAKKYIKIGLILLLGGISVGIVSNYVFKSIEAAAAASGNVVAEVATVVGGTTGAYALAGIAIALIALALIFLIMGWTKD